MNKSLIIILLGCLSLSGFAQSPLSSFEVKDSKYSLWIDVVDTKYGIRTQDRKSLLPPVYDNIWFDSENSVFYIFKTVCCGSLTLVGFADEKGQLVQEPIFTNMTAFYGGQACVEMDLGLAVINKLGQWVVSPQDSMNHILLQDSFTNEFFYQTLRDTSWQNSLEALSVEQQWIIKKGMIPIIAPLNFISPQLYSPITIKGYPRGKRSQTQLKLENLLWEADFINLRIQSYTACESIPIRHHYTATIKRP